MTWQWQPALGAGIFFELLWLDTFPAGTYIPPHGLAALCTSLIVLHSLETPSMRMTTFVILAACPLAYCGAWLEQTHRTRQNRSYTELLRWNRKSQHSAHTPGVLTWISMTEQILFASVLSFIVSMLALYAARTLPPWFFDGYQPSWTFLWIMACIGGVLSVRIPKAFVVCALTVGLGLAMRFL